MPVCSALRASRSLVFSRLGLGAVLLALLVGLPMSRSSWSGVSARAIVLGALERVEDALQELPGGESARPLVALLHAVPGRAADGLRGTTGRRCAPQSGTSSPRCCALGAGRLGSEPGAGIGSWHGLGGCGLSFRGRCCKIHNGPSKLTARPSAGRPGNGAPPGAPLLFLDTFVTRTIASRVAISASSRSSDATAAVSSRAPSRHGGAEGVRRATSASLIRWRSSRTRASCRINSLINRPSAFLGWGHFQE